MINLFQIDVIKALIYSAVINALIAPVILVLIVIVAGKKELMGKMANSPVSNFVGWLTVIIMAIAGLATIITQIF